jgi:disulfide bond formation protein DsbB
VVGAAGGRRFCCASGITQHTISGLAALGVAGQVLAGLGLLFAAMAVVRIWQPLEFVREAVWGYELWAAFVVSSIATGGSLFFSEIAHFVPCELCWYQRICMYPLSILTLIAAIRSDFRLARYLLVLPVVGACVSVYHLLVENGVVGQSTACLVSAPGGCAVKWIDKFGYMTIPTLALTAFVLLIELLGLASAGDGGGVATLTVDAERQIQ